MGDKAKGRHIIIIGNEQHPEVIGIKGWADGPVTVIETKEQAEQFEAKKTKIHLLCHKRHLTTRNLKI